MSATDVLVRMLVQEQTPPATGSGSRLGSAVVIVSGLIPVWMSLTKTQVSLPLSRRVYHSSRYGFN
jgi:hypothetical protein